MRCRCHSSTTNRRAVPSLSSGIRILPTSITTTPPNGSAERCRPPDDGGSHRAGGCQVNADPGPRESSDPERGPEQHLRLLRRGPCGAVLPGELRGCADCVDATHQKCFGRLRLSGDVFRRLPLDLKAPSFKVSKIQRSMSSDRNYIALVHESSRRARTTRLSWMTWTASSGSPASAPLSRRPLRIERAECWLISQTLFTLAAMGGRSSSTNRGWRT